MEVGWGRFLMVVLWLLRGYMLSTGSIAVLFLAIDVACSWCGRRLFLPADTGSHNRLKVDAKRRILHNEAMLRMCDNIQSICRSTDMPEDFPSSYRPTHPKIRIASVPVSSIQDSIILKLTPASTQRFETWHITFQPIFSPTSQTDPLHCVESGICKTLKCCCCKRTNSTNVRDTLILSKTSAWFKYISLHLYIYTVNIP